MNKSENPRFLLGLQKSRTIFVSLSLIFFLFMMIGETFGQNLMVIPKRVIFDGSKRAMDVTLANTGNDPATYEISFVNFRMNDDGSYTQIESPDSGQYFADPFLRYYPRTVQLPGGGAQTIKLQLTRTDKLQPGEYRSHLWFRGVPDTKPLGSDDKRTDSTSEVSVKLIPIFGITIPVIIRTGTLNLKVNLKDISLDMTSDSLPKLKMTITREGNISAYGDITVNYISPGGKTIQVGLVRGVGIYTPNPIRVFQCPLEKKEDVNYRAGTLQILYNEPVETKSGLLAKADYPLR